MPLLSIAILSSNRFDLLEATIHSLLSTIEYPNFELIVYNQDGSIGQGWNELTKRVRGDYILMCQDDWYFIEKWDWVQQAIEILKEDNAGIVRLRKMNDGQVEEKILATKNIPHSLTCDKSHQYHEVECIGGGFSMNPFIAKKSLIEELGEVKNTIKQKGIAEIELRERYASKKYRTFKLGNPARGICVHIGRGRRIFGVET